jgi:hypothetical protein
MRLRDRLFNSADKTSAADGLKLTEADLAAIEQAVPKGAAKGERYPAQAMAHLDSEKRD